jgi:hypothetical protein
MGGIRRIKRSIELYQKGHNLRRGGGLESKKRTRGEARRKKRMRTSGFKSWSERLANFRRRFPR